MRSPILTALLLVGCVSERPSRLEQAVGEPSGTFPSPEERLLLMAANRARSDPAIVKGPNSTIYPAQAPVVWSYELTRAARFHCINLMQARLTLMHSSACTLNSNVAGSGCNGDPACACASPVPAICQNCAAQSNCGTDPFVRIGYFTAGTATSARSEIGAAGFSGPMAAMDGWVGEPTGADGHRTAVLDGNSNVMGFGHAGGSGCWSAFDFGDLGRVNGLTIPKLPSAAVNPTRGSAGTFTVYATWADSANGNPSALYAVVDGVCQAMSRELGSPTLNSTWKVAVSLGAGCHSYWILARDAAGTRLTYPTTGALTISVGGTACGAEYLVSAPSAGCETASADLATAADLTMMADLRTTPTDLATTIDLRATTADLTMMADLRTTTTDLATMSDLQAMIDLVTADELRALADQAGEIADLTTGGAAIDLGAADRRSVDSVPSGVAAGCGCAVGGKRRSGDAPWLVLLAWFSLYTRRAGCLHCESNG